MCGRFALTANTGKIEKLLPDTKVKFDLSPRYNIAPTQKIAAILNSNPHEIVQIRWGLIPSWAKDEAIGNNLINARAEGINEKPSFKFPFRKKRCLILTDGFYEWKQIKGEKRKQPYLIKMKSGEFFTFAGIWDSWKSPASETIISASIITTTPNELVTEIHSRMPVILNSDDRHIWLGEESESNLLTLLKPYSAEEMTAFPVSLKVNNPAYDFEDCQETLD